MYHTTRRCATLTLHCMPILLLVLLVGKLDEEGKHGDLRDGKVISVIIMDHAYSVQSPCVSLFSPYRSVRRSRVPERLGDGRCFGEGRVLTSGWPVTWADPKPSAGHAGAVIIG